MPLYLTEGEVDRLLGPPDALAAVEGALARLGAGEIAGGSRRQMPLEDGDFGLAHAVDRGLGLAGAKTYARLPGGRPVVLVLLSLERAEVEAIVEAEALGRWGAGAASGVAAAHLARAGARSLGVIGCGRRAEVQVACIRAAVPTIEETVAYCRDPRRLDAFCARTGARPGESHDAAARQDVVVTATSSRDPVVRGEWLREGALVCAVGANEPDARELDNVVLRRAAFVCTDSAEEGRALAGDLIEPVAQGVLDWLEVHELHEVVAGELPGRQADEDVVLFKSNGIAAWDLAVGAAVVELARERGAGRQL